MKTQNFSFNLFTDRESALLEDIFQKTPRPNGTSIQKTSMEMQISSKTIWNWFFRRRRREEPKTFDKKELKNDTNVTNKPLPEKMFNCIFCEEVSCFRLRQPAKYERHLKSKHKVIFKLNILYFVNFIDKEKKKIFIDEAKKTIQKGDLFKCSLCQGEHYFVVGQFVEFKQHLGLFHKILFEVGFVLSISFFSAEIKTLILNDNPENEIEKNKSF